MSRPLRVGMGNRYGLRMVVLKSDDFDPEAVTGGTFKITKPNSNGTTTDVEWPVTLSAQGPLSVTASYAFDSDGTDLDYPGNWTVWIQWTEPGFTPGPRTEVSSFRVVAANQA